MEFYPRTKRERYEDHWDDELFDARFMLPPKTFLQAWYIAFIQQRVR